MIFKTIKIFLFCWLLFISVAFSQINNTDTNNSITGKYNAWLKICKLEKFLTAQSIHDSITNKGEKVKVLVLNPVNAYNDPLKASAVWDYLSNGINERGGNIYEILITKFANYSNLPLNSVIVTINSNKPQIFSVKIYYKLTLHYDEKKLSIRGQDYNFEYDFSTSPLGVIQGSYHLPNGNKGLKAYCKNLIFFFKHGNDKTSIDTEVYTDEMIRLKVIYPYGHVTSKKYHEIIFLDIHLVHLDKNQLQVLYDGDVLYSGGIFTVPKDVNKYEDATTSFYKNLVNYNRELDSEFQQLLYGDK